MSIKKQRVHFAAVVCFRYASLLSNYIAWRKAKKTEVPRSGNKFENTLSAERSCQDIKFSGSLLRSLRSVKEKTKLSMEYFDSETFIKQKEIVPFTISALSPPAKFAFKCPTQTEFFTEVCCVINGCCRTWQSHLLVLLFLLLVFFSPSASFHEAKIFFLSHRSRKRTLHLRKK